MRGWLPIISCYRFAHHVARGCVTKAYMHDTYVRSPTRAGLLTCAMHACCTALAASDSAVARSVPGTRCDRIPRGMANQTYISREEYVWFTGLVYYEYQCRILAFRAQFPMQL